MFNKKTTIHNTELSKYGDNTNDRQEKTLDNNQVRQQAGFSSSYMPEAGTEREHILSVSRRIMGNTTLIRYNVI